LIRDGEGYLPGIDLLMLRLDNRVRHCVDM
jgi:hypothetical protein